jgi:hypothetical protein
MNRGLQRLDGPEQNGLGDIFSRAARFAAENPLLVIAGASIAVVGGVALGSYLVSRGDNVIVYLDQGEGSGEFRTVANRMARAIGATVYPAHNGAQVLEAIRRHRRIKTLILAGHGTTTQFLRPGHGGIRANGDASPTWISTDTFAREVGPRMAAGGVISWAGCSAASDPGESTWSNLSYGPGGDRSFIGRVRDAMARLPFVAWNVEHRGHAAPGHTTANPSARVCRVARSEIGQECDSLMDEQWGANAYQTMHRQWADAFEGAPAEAWMAGATVTVPRGAAAEVRYA